MYQSPGDNSKASTNPRLFSLCPPRRNCSASRVNGMKQSCPAGPTFNIQFNSSSVDEGESFSFTVQTTNYQGNELYYTLSGTGITVDDLISNQLTGQYTVRNNDQPSTFTNITAMDYFTEGTETITVRFIF